MTAFVPLMFPLMLYVLMFGEGGRGTVVVFCKVHNSVGVLLTAPVYLMLPCVSDEIFGALLFLCTQRYMGVVSMYVLTYIPTCIIPILG